MAASKAQLESRLKINRNTLDDELVEQASLYYQAAMDYAAKMSRVAFLDNEGDRLRAKLDKLVRQSHESDEKKPTEPQIKAEIESKKLWRKHNDEFLKAKQEEAEAHALKESYAQRSYALKDLAAIHMTQFYSSDSVYENQKDQKSKKLRNAVQKAVKS